MCDFLPQSVHAILNEFETTLSLPTLLVIVFCTAQFFICDITHIICTVQEIIRKKCAKRSRQKKCPKPPCPGLMDCLKELAASVFCPKGCAAPPSGPICKKPKRCKPACKRVRDSEPKTDDDIDDDDDEDDDE